MTWKLIIIERGVSIIIQTRVIQLFSNLQYRESYFSTIKILNPDFNKKTTKETKPATKETKPAKKTETKKPVPSKTKSTTKTVPKK